MKTVRLTMAQALVRFLSTQYVERDEVRQRFFAGVWGIFGHGNVAGIGQALDQYSSEMPFILSRNEQAQVHAAAGYARQKKRLQTWACTSSVGPGATNMITGAAGATINRLPVLLLPGDVFASRRPAPVLQQLESQWSHDVSVNDAFKPVSRYWDRISRPEQLMSAAIEAMRVLTDPADTGAVTLALPEDVQTEAFDYPEDFLRERTWRIPRQLPDMQTLRDVAELIRKSERPMIVAGGGVIYSDATDALRAFVDKTGIAVGETMAGKGSLPFDHPLCLGAIGATGTHAANVIARDADLIIGVGTRWSDFTTASKSAFQNPDARFVSINVARFDALKLGSIGATGDARATLEVLRSIVEDFHTNESYRALATQLSAQWDERVDSVYSRANAPLPSQGEIIGAVNDAAAEHDVVVCAAGSLPGDLHKLWRTKQPGTYHVEYGYSCMGYEVAGALGVKMASPDREVFVMVGDGSWLMMSSEIVTSIQEGFKLIVVLIDNHGYASIGGLSESLGSAGFGTEYRLRNGADGRLTGGQVEVDFARNAESMGAAVIRAASIDDLRRALKEAKEIDRTVVITIETDRNLRVGSFESWWDVPVAEVSEQSTVRAARESYDENVRRARWLT